MKTKINVFKDQVKGIYGDWGATIDIGDNQIQVISPSKAQRNQMVKLVKTGFKAGLKEKE